MPTLKPFINQMVNKANSKNKIFTKAKYVAFLWHNYFQAFAKPIQLNFFRNSILVFGGSCWKATNVGFQAGIPTKPLQLLKSFRKCILQLSQIFTRREGLNTIPLSVNTRTCRSKFVTKVKILICAKYFWARVKLSTINRTNNNLSV